MAKVSPVRPPCEIICMCTDQVKEDMIRVQAVAAFVDLCRYKRCHIMGYTAKDRDLRDTVLLALESVGRFDDSPWGSMWYKLA